MTALATTLVLGGARSGKSAFAEQLVEESGLGRIYLAMGDLTNAEVLVSKAYKLYPIEQNEQALAAIRKRIATERQSATK